MRIFPSTRRCTFVSTIHTSRNLSRASSCSVTRPLSTGAVSSPFNRCNAALRAETTKSRACDTECFTRNLRSLSTMSPRRQGQTAFPGAGETKAKTPKPPATLRPSASILLVSPTNEVLLLHRVHTSSAFASAHVFPGGNLSAFHDGPLPDTGNPAVHEDGPAYRLAAIRETFEESGILLARKSGQSQEQGLLHVPDDVREAGRKLVHDNKVKFTEWLRSVGGEPDVDNLVPFTRWITPHGPPKRFTTQMYLYMLPLASEAQASQATNDSVVAAAAAAAGHETIVPMPTHDGGLEHTAATFDPAHVWLAKARANDIILFPPQFYLLHLVSAFLNPPPTHGEPLPAADYRAQRAALLAFLAKTPTTTTTPTPGPSHKTQLDTSRIPWSDKVISPTVLFARHRDGCLVLGLDKPGPELRQQGGSTSNGGRLRGGDGERVVLVRFMKEGPRDVEVRWRREVLEEEREVGGGDGEGRGKGKGAKL